MCRFLRQMSPVFRAHVVRLSPSTHCIPPSSYVRSKQKRKERVGPLKRGDGSEEVIEDDEEAAKVLNKYFSSVFTLEDLGNIPEPKQTCLDSGNGLAQIISTKKNVVEQLKRLKTDKSPGMDELHPKFLHEVR